MRDDNLAVLDDDWVKLMMEAKKAGIQPKEIRKFLKKNRALDKSTV